MDTQERQRLTAIQGNPPLLYQKPTICPFASRCVYAFERCWKENPPLVAVDEKHKVACWWDVKKGGQRDV
jgi:oligopeptide/dipeptide ABC transporter ATP-binding protein